MTYQACVRIETNVLFSGVFDSIPALVRALDELVEDTDHFYTISIEHENGTRYIHLTQCRGGGKAELVGTVERNVGRNCFVSHDL
jgi:hypothetical protein